MTMCTYTRTNVPKIQPFQDCSSLLCIHPCPVCSWCNMMFHIYNHPNQCPYQVSTSYTLRFSRCSPEKILKVTLPRARSKINSMSYHRITHLHPQPLRYTQDKIFPAPTYRKPERPSILHLNFKNNIHTAFKCCVEKSIRQKYENMKFTSKRTLLYFHNLWNL